MRRWFKGTRKTRPNCFPGCTWSYPTSSAPILDVFHGVSPKHLQSYLDEFCYRLNRRWQRTDLFRRILNRCVRYTEPVTYAQLTAS